LIQYYLGNITGLELPQPCIAPLRNLEESVALASRRQPNAAVATVVREPPGFEHFRTPDDSFTNPLQESMRHCNFNGWRVPNKSMRNFALAPVSWMNCVGFYAFPWCSVFLPAHVVGARGQRGTSVLC
jgi:hypothetical protein